MTKNFCDYCGKEILLDELCSITANPETKGKSIVGFYAFMGRDEVCFDCWKKVAIFISTIKKEQE